MPTYNFIDRTNQRFGRLIVTKRSPNKNGRTMWECLCDCGNSTVIRGEHLRNNASTSCGCYSKESHTIHDMARSNEYKIWTGMKGRCFNNNNPSFHNYGARGITVSKEWAESFEQFFKDMGKRPRGLSIDRIDNNKGYSKENCRWATHRQQVNNRRNSILHTIEGETKCLREWCCHFNISYSTVRHRLSKNWDMNKALTTRPNS